MIRFSNIKEIQNVHKILQIELQKVEENFPWVDEIGTVLIKIAPHLKVYGEYVNNFKTASDVLQRNLENNKKFQIWITEREQQFSNKLMELGLRSLLSLPINHLNTYQYHLKLMTENTPLDHLGTILFIFLFYFILFYLFYFIYLFLLFIYFYFLFLLFIF